MGKEEKDKSMNPLEEPPSERFDLSMGLVIDTASPPREKDCLRFDLDVETTVERRIGDLEGLLSDQSEVNSIFLLSV